MIIHQLQQNIVKTLSTFIVIGSFLAIFPNVKAEKQLTNITNSPSNSSLISYDLSNLPPEFAKNGWGKSSQTQGQKQTFNSTNTKLENSTLQSNTSSYVCNSNYFTSHNNTFTSALAADGLGNLYTNDFNISNLTFNISKISASGSITTITQPNSYIFGNIVASLLGDVYQIAFDYITNTTKVFKVQSGSTDFILIYTLSSEKITSPQSLKIDSNGNLYLNYYIRNVTNNIIISTNIHKLNSSGALLSTTILPSLSNGSLYALHSMEVSSGNLIYIATTSDFYAIPIFIFSTVVINSDGTLKGIYNYSSSGIPVKYEVIKILVIPATSGGGVYVLFSDQIYGQMQIKKILDSDIFPIPSTVSMTVRGFYALNSTAIVDYSNTYIYIYQSQLLKRIKIDDPERIEFVLPMSTINYSLSMARNSSNEIIFAQHNSSDLFKLDCTTIYSPTILSQDNIKNNGNPCYLNTTGLNEDKSYQCYLLLSKGLTYTIPPGFQVKFEGSSNFGLNCVKQYESVMYCPSIPYSDLYNSIETNIQFSLNNSTYFNVAKAMTWQPFSGWSPNSITLNGQTDEILYNSKMYQAAWGTDNGLYLRSMDNTNMFSNWQRLGNITANTTPTLSLDPNGDLYVFSRGTDNGLYFWKVGEVGGEKWRRLGAITIKDGVSLHNFNGKYWLYATGTDNGLYVSKYTSFSAASYANPNWTKAGDITVNKTVQGGVVNSKLHQIAIGTDSGLYTREMTNLETWSNWSRYSPRQYGAISKPNYLNNQMVLSILPLNETVQENYINFTDKANKLIIYNFNRLTSDSIGIFNNYLTFAGIGAGSKLYYKNSENNIFQSFSLDIQGNNITIKNSPTQFSFNGKQYQFVRGTDNKLWARSRN